MFTCLRHPAPWLRKAHNQKNHLDRSDEFYFLNIVFIQKFNSGHPLHTLKKQFCPGFPGCIL